MFAFGSSSGLVTLFAAASPIIAAGFGVYLSTKVRQVHTLVNSQMTIALERIVTLESKLGLSPGEAVPGAAIVTQPSPGADAAPAE